MPRACRHYKADSQVIEEEPAESAEEADTWFRFLFTIRSPGLALGLVEG